MSSHHHDPIYTSALNLYEEAILKDSPHDFLAERALYNFQVPQNLASIILAWKLLTGEYPPGISPTHPAMVMARLHQPERPLKIIHRRGKHGYCGRQHIGGDRAEFTDDPRDHGPPQRLCASYEPREPQNRETVKTGGSGTYTGIRTDRSKGKGRGSGGKDDRLMSEINYRRGGRPDTSFYSVARRQPRLTPVKR